jgi:hypothetical protein
VLHGSAARRDCKKEAGQTLYVGLRTVWKTLLQGLGMILGDG